MAKKIDLDRLGEFKALENGSVATVETGSTASKPYAIGDYFYFKGKLVKATAAIASGGTITLNTNCALAQLADDLASQSEKIDATEPVIEHSTTSILDPFADKFPTKGKYISNKNGTLSNNASWSTTDYIPVKPGHTYVVTSYPSTGYFVLFYDENKQTPGNSTWYLSSYKSGILSIPRTTHWRYMRMSISTSYQADFDVLDGDSNLRYYGEEAYKSTGLYVEVGSDKEYTTIREAVRIAGRVPNSTVVVHKGTYDLAQEYSDVISSGGTAGVNLRNGINLIFLAGSYVTCLLDNTVASYEEFQPFYAQHDQYPFNASFTLNGLRMTASNCRYCVHDELETYPVPYVHNYINCEMHYSNTFTNPKYVQCIGGGLGVNGYINIDGGFYDGQTSVPASSASTGQIPISYHNTSDGSGDSKIFIKNVYLNGTGHLRFGYYGTSQTITPVYVSGCSFGASIEKRAENETALIDNFSITEWNNTIRT